MEKVTLIIECDLLPYFDREKVIDSIRQALENDGDCYVDIVRSVTIRKEKG